MKEKDKEKRIHSSGLRLVRQKEELLEFEPGEEADLDEPGQEVSASGRRHRGEADLDEPGQEVSAPDRRHRGEADLEEPGQAPSRSRRGKRKPQEPEYEADFENDDEEWEEEAEPTSPWITALTFLGLAVLAAIICGILWYFTHPDKPEESGQDQVMTQESGTMDPEPGTESGTEPAPEQTEEPEESSIPADDPGTEEENGTAGTDQSGQGESDEPPGEVISGTASMGFTELKESVTPKDVVNLRSVPSTANEADIVVQCQNGEVLTRTGINQDTGWSKVEYGGETLYAVTQYLTTDLDYKPPVQPSDPNRVSTISGRIIIFSNCDDWISPKEYVNLRTEPSTTEGESTVNCQLNNGEKVHRTGYSTDSGWSRVEYNGQVLYVVTSLMNVVEE